MKIDERYIKRNVEEINEALESKKIKVVYDVIDDKYFKYEMRTVTEDGYILQVRSFENSRIFWNYLQGVKYGLNI